MEIAPKLSTPVGDILVQEGGVTFEPVSGSSKYCPWQFVPTIMEGVCAVADGEDAQVLSMLGESEKDALESAIGRIEFVPEGDILYLEHDSDALASVEALLEWLPMMAEHSPEPVASRLRQILK